MTSMQGKKIVAVILSMAIFALVATSFGIAQFLSHNLQEPAVVDGPQQPQVVAEGQSDVEEPVVPPHAQRVKETPGQPEFIATMDDFFFAEADDRVLEDDQSLNVGPLVQRIKTAHEAAPIRGENLAKGFFAAARRSSNGGVAIGLAVAEIIVRDLSGTPAAAAAREYQIGYHFSRVGRLDAELAAGLQEFAELFPNDPRPVRIHRQIADALMSNGRYEDAFALLHRAVEDHSGVRDYQLLQQHLNTAEQLVANRSNPSDPGTEAHGAEDATRVSDTD